jgi:effector-binding domain-containing protein
MLALTNLKVSNNQGGGMKIEARKIKIFKIKNRRGYAAICANHLTEGATLPQVYERMQKALKRNGMEIKSNISDLKKLVTSL